MVEVEQSAEALGFANDPIPRTGSLVGEGDDIIEPLVIALLVIMIGVFVERTAQGSLAEADQLTKAFILHKTHPMFGESIEVGRLCGESDRLDAGGAEEGIKGF